jgi:hypothetical protein
LQFVVEWRDQIRRFLSPLKFGIRHRDISDLITPGTGKWFLRSHEFQDWVKSREDSNQVLCCVGDPGVGKTGLAYSVPLDVNLKHVMTQSQVFGIRVSARTAKHG